MKETANRRNGKSTKELRGDAGPMEIEVPRDREGAFEPQIMPRHQREWRSFDDKILSLYALGLTTRQIQDHQKELGATEFHTVYGLNRTKGLNSGWAS